VAPSLQWEVAAAYAPACWKNVAEMLLKRQEMQGFVTHFEPLNCLTLTSFNY
jgi:hypothetical protein